MDNIMATREIVCDSLQAQVQARGTLELVETVVEAIGEAKERSNVDSNLVNVESNVVEADTEAEVANDGSNFPDSAEASSKLSKYAQKKLARLEVVKNSIKVKNNKAVPSAPEQIHNKVSRNLLLAKRHTLATVVCDVTGIVSHLDIPAIPNKVLVFASPFSSYANCRGIAQEGHDYLHRLDTQILAGIFIVLAGEYDLLRFTPSATGAENNAILRTVSKEKIIQGILLIESFIHSSNCTFTPRLSMVYDEILKEQGMESRYTEWLRLVNESLADPDISEYNEAVLLNRPMRSLRELQEEGRAENKAKRKAATATKDTHYKERAAFRKDMKEALSLLPSLEAAPKLINFLKQLFKEDVLLTVDTTLIGQLIEKLSHDESATASKIISILCVNRDDLRKLDSIDDLDDPLMQGATEAKGEKEKEIEVGEIHIDDDELPIEDRIAILDVGIRSAEQEESEMPKGLSFTEKLLWKKKHKGNS